MTYSSYQLVYNNDEEEEMIEIMAYSREQAYLFSLQYCNPDDIVSLECTVRKCCY